MERLHMSNEIGRIGKNVVQRILVCIMAVIISVMVQQKETLASVSTPSPLHSDRYGQYLGMVSKSSSKLVSDCVIQLSHECHLEIDYGTGIHTSLSDSMQHLLVRIYRNAEETRYASCHIYNEMENGQYKTQCWRT